MRTLLALCAVLTLGACSKTSSAPRERSSAPAATATPIQPGPREAPPSKPGPEGTPPTMPGPEGAPRGKQYALWVETKRETRAGVRGTYEIVIEPKGSFHINQDYPFEITVASPEVKLEKARFAKADAKKFTNTEVRVEGGFVPARPGPAAFTAQVRFAVCTDKDCWPQRETLQWKTTVLP